MLRKWGTPIEELFSDIAPIPQQVSSSWWKDLRALSNIPLGHVEEEMEPETQRDEAIKAVRSAFMKRTTERVGVLGKDTKTYKDVERSIQPEDLRSAASMLRLQAEQAKQMR